MSSVWGFSQAKSPSSYVYFADNWTGFEKGKVSYSIDPLIFLTTREMKATGTIGAHGNARNCTYMDGHVESNKCAKVNPSSSLTGAENIWSCSESSIVGVIN